MPIKFWCAVCGNPLEAQDRDAGRSLECVKCHSIVSVPKNPHVPTIESAQEELRVTQARQYDPEHDIHDARRGLRLLILSLVIFSAQFTYWVFLLDYVWWNDELTQYFQGVSTGFSDWIYWSLIIDIFATTLRGVFRYVGYRKCRRFGVYLDDFSPLTLCSVGSILYTVGVAALTSCFLISKLNVAVFYFVVTTAQIAILLGFIGLIMETRVNRFLDSIFEETSSTNKQKTRGQIDWSVAIPVAILAIVYLYFMFLLIISVFQGWPRIGGQPIFKQWLPTFDQAFVAISMYAILSMFAVNRHFFKRLFRAIGRLNQFVQLRNRPKEIEGTTATNNAPPTNTTIS